MVSDSEQARDHRLGSCGIDTEGKGGYDTVSCGQKKFGQRGKWDAM
jgi:hypothetical protein